MSDLRELYQEVIFDHNRSPRNFGKLDDANRTAEGYNPVCGDQVKLYVRVEDGIIRDVSFDGQGCAISTASASIMTEALKGKTEQEAENYFKSFQALVTGEGEADDSLEEMFKLEVLGGVREFPMRVKCATLPWHTIHAALENKTGSVTTE